MTMRLPIALLTLSLLITSRVAAQRATTRPISVGVGVGYGMARVSCAGCANPTREGPAASLFITGTLSPVVRLGIETSAWAGWHMRLWNFSLVAYDYLDQRSKYFIKGGVGLAQYHSRGAVLATNGFGPGFMGGLGYVGNIGTTSSIGPVATVRYGFVGSVDEGLTGSHSRSQFVLDLGVLLRFGWSWQ